MPVVGSADKYGIDRLVVEHAAHVLHLLWRASPLLFFNNGGEFRGKLRVWIADVYNLATGNFGKFPSMRLATNAAANNGHTHRVGWLSCRLVF